MRFEYKYFLPYRSYLPVRNDILKFCCYDNLCIGQPGCFYYVKSLYYDTYDYDSLFDKDIGILERTKYRLRVYYEDKFDNIKVEMKHHIDDMYKKEVNSIALKEKGANLSKDFFEKYASKFFFNINNLNLSPSILISYKRTAFQDKKKDGIRITIDKDIRYGCNELSLYGKTDRKLFYTGYILEVKFKRVLPFWAKQILSKYDLLRTAISKYCICIEDNKKIQ
ncbi:MAG: polyphosphate polymerase domain-containing protein [Elusimicrobia bacterium]|nr:polyphosphate polymerase domain-containing protein [Elusimicrobiota bacterium]